MIFLLRGTASKLGGSRPRTRTLADFGPKMGTSNKPKLVVFDLDYTLWPQHVDSTVDPPLRKDKNGHIFDSYGQAIKPFPEVPALLEYLRAEGYEIAAASRTEAPPVANELIKLLNWDRYFDYREIYPGCKTTHFNRFHKQTGHAFTDMIFFDDERRNIRDVSKLGVTAVFVGHDGMTRRLFDEGLAEWRQHNARN